MAASPADMTSGFAENVPECGKRTFCGQRVEHVHDVGAAGDGADRQTRRR